MAYKLWHTVVGVDEPMTSTLRAARERTPSSMFARSMPTAKGRRSYTTNPRP